MHLKVWGVFLLQFWAEHKFVSVFRFFNLIDTKRSQTDLDNIEIVFGGPLVGFKLWLTKMVSAHSRAVRKFKHCPLRKYQICERIQKGYIC